MILHLTFFQVFLFCWGVLGGGGLMRQQVGRCPIALAYEYGYICIYSGSFKTQLMMRQDNFALIRVIRKVTLNPPPLSPLSVVSAK
jgi:hypothetical protein